mmetsp:Transcript_24572/g.59267  ORF Transcript_24572/g.59267 Transcript_24572/m.59267 type:complete len:247 (+) Transcript_24572:277-1017(+)
MRDPLLIFERKSFLPSTAPLRPEAKKLEPPPREERGVIEPSTSIFMRDSREGVARTLLGPDDVSGASSSASNPPRLRLGIDMPVLARDCRTSSAAVAASSSRGLARSLCESGRRVKSSSSESSWYISDPSLSLPSSSVRGPGSFPSPSRGLRLNFMGTAPSPDVTGFASSETAGAMSLGRETSAPDLTELLAFSLFRRADSAASVCSFLRRSAASAASFRSRYLRSRSALAFAFASASRSILSLSR